MAREMTKAERFRRIPMREQDPKLRAANFTEVPFGYSEEEAMAEAGRCLQCKKPLCIEGCPVNVKIPQFIALIGEGKFIEAARKLRETNALPAICGRVCLQEEQCEIRCSMSSRRLRSPGLSTASMVRSCFSMCRVTRSSSARPVLVKSRA